MQNKKILILMDNSVKTYKKAKQLQLQSLNVWGLTSAFKKGIIHLCRSKIDNFMTVSFKYLELVSISTATASAGNWL